MHACSQACVDVLLVSASSQTTPHPPLHAICACPATPAVLLPLNTATSITLSCAHSQGIGCAVLVLLHERVCLDTVPEWRRACTRGPPPPQPPCTPGADLHPCTLAAGIPARAVPAGGPPGHPPRLCTPPLPSHGAGRARTHPRCIHIRDCCRACDALDPCSSASLARHRSLGVPACYRSCVAATDDCHACSTSCGTRCGTRCTTDPGPSQNWSTPGLLQRSTRECRPSR